MTDKMLWKSKRGMTGQKGMLRNDTRDHQLGKGLEDGQRERERYRVACGCGDFFE